MKPVLLVDVDGVLAPFDYDHPECEKRQTSPWGSINLLIPAGSYLRELAVFFDLAWGTWWEDRANSILAPFLGIPALPVCNFSDGQFWTNETVKLPSIKAFVGDRPAAWIDDDMGEDVFAWAEERNAMGIPTLVVKTDPYVGITEYHVAKLRDFSLAVQSATLAA